MPRGQNPTLEIYLNLLLPWEAKYSSEYKCVSHTYLNRNNERKFLNYAVQDYDELLRLCETRCRFPNADVYLALGTQKELREGREMTRDGFPQADRTVKNIHLFKSIYLDIDVGKNGAYASTDEAWEALDDFCSRQGMPPPTMVVYSGSGGLHVYWCTPDPMTVEQWIPLSRGLKQAALNYGLKFDPQVTTNIVGILRVPGSLNYKNFPPKQVFMYEDTGFQRYDVRLLEACLQQFIQPTLRVVGGTQHVGMNANFGSNIPAASVPPVPIDALTPHCGVISDILAREGNGDKEPLWNMALYAATFTDQPNDAAHRMSRGDPRYDFGATEKKLFEKLNARATSGMGWPTCAQFSALHPACQSCPLLGQQKSPFHFVKQQPVLAAGTQQQINILPHGYWRDSVTQYVMTTVQVKNDPRVVTVFNYPLADAAIDSDNGDLAIKICRHGVEGWSSVNIHSNVQPSAVASKFAQARIYLQSEGKQYEYSRNFAVAWLSHLQYMKKTIESVPYGWTDDGRGFSFGEKTYYPNNEELALYRNSAAEKRFDQQGDLQPWKDACAGLIYGNAGLETILASSFAAPLVDLISNTSLILSFYSHESGVGKSTAMQMAQAVWGNPRTGMSSLDDTNNSVIKKVADIRNLPVYWDELRSQDNIEKVINLVFQVTQGKSKARLGRDIQQQSVSTFTTLLVCASNHGLSDTIYANTVGTQAGGVRVFEMEVPPFISNLQVYDAKQLALPVDKNFGVAGAAYARFIVNWRNEMKDAMLAVQRDLHARYNLHPKERFWAMTIAAIVVGAEMANRSTLTTFNVPAIQKYLEDTFLRLRAQLVDQSHNTISSPDDAFGLLQDMLSEVRGRHLVVTDRIHYGRGAPRNVKVVDTKVDQLQGVWAQMGALDGRIRLKQRHFDAWLREKKQHPDYIVGLLRNLYVVTRSKQALGAGVPLLDATSGRSMCIDLTPKNPITFPGSIPDETDQ